MRRFTPRTVATSLTALVWAQPGVAWPCPACYSAGGEGLLAYLWTAVLLSVLPLAMIGGLVLTVRRRARAHRLAPIPARESSPHIRPAGD
jgi:hypothetical protein